MGQFATGITVVFTMGGSGPHGMTVNSLTSVSLDPPLILFCVDNHARTRHAVGPGERFTVSILRQEQESLSRLFADPATPDSVVDRLPIRTVTAGMPILRDALAYLDCVVDALYPGGDHQIVVGRVEDFDVLNHGNPLVYFSGRYYTARNGE